MDKKIFSKCLDDLAVKNVSIKKQILKFSRDMVRQTYIEQHLLDTSDVTFILDVTSLSMELFRKEAMCLSMTLVQSLISSPDLIGS